MMLSQILKGCGFETREAQHGKEALVHLSANADTSLALIDWNMPEMNGLELVRAVRANTAWSGIKLVMVTTENELSYLEQALGAGANEYLMKPFTKDVLIDKLRLIGLA